MESIIVKHLRPTYEPVAVVWSDSIPDDAIQYKTGKFGCILYLFANASRRGKVSGGSRETVVCPGGRAAMGFGVGLDSSEEDFAHYTAIFSKGLQSAFDKSAFQAHLEAAPPKWRDLYAFGERRHCSPELAGEWIRRGLPRYDISQKFVLFKPLSLATAEDNVKAVIFAVNPIELAGLVTLAGSVLPGTDPVQVPQGADCNTLGAFAYAQEESDSPRAVLGMLGVDGREMMQKRFNSDTLTITLTLSLFRLMEKEADNCVLQLPSWKKLVGESGKVNKART
ncbi:DUF169 domain-containing protein [bacterium]|nr:DUF169 domain-containing protein [bacterium]